MPQAPRPNCKYNYSHHDQKELSQAIDIHDISVAKSRVPFLLSYFGTLLFVASSCYFLLVKVCCTHSLLHFLFHCVHI